MMITEHPERVSGTHSLVAPDDPPVEVATALTPEHLQRRDVLGGLIHEYELVAA